MSLSNSTDPSSPPFFNYQNTLIIIICGGVLGALCVAAIFLYCWKRRPIEYHVEMTDAQFKLLAQQNTDRFFKRSNPVPIVYPPIVATPSPDGTPLTRTAPI